MAPLRSRQLIAQIAAQGLLVAARLGPETCGLSNRHRSSKEQTTHEQTLMFRQRFGLSARHSALYMLRDECKEITHLPAGGCERHFRVNTSSIMLVRHNSSKKDGRIDRRN